VIYFFFSWCERGKAVLQRLLKIFCESSHLSYSEFLISWGFGDLGIVLENREVYRHMYCSCSGSVFVWRHLVSNGGRD